MTSEKTKHVLAVVLFWLLIGVIVGGPFCLAYLFGRAEESHPIQIMRMLVVSAAVCWLLLIVFFQVLFERFSGHL